jgi:hypothetical protein
MRWFGSVGKQLSNIFTRVTLTRWHLALFLVAFVHCAALIFLQSVSFVINEEARDFMVHLMTMTSARRDALAVVATRPRDTLFLCQKVPGNGFSGSRNANDMLNTGACTQMSPPPPAADVEVDIAQRNVLYPDDMVLVPDVREDKKIFGLSIVGLGNSTGIVDPNGNLWVSSECIASLRYPEQEFQDAGRENVSFLFFHVWTLGITILAILNESIPHLASALAGQCLATGWAAWDLSRTVTFRNRYEELIGKGLCSGAQLIPHYWPTRNRLNVAIACINFGTLALTFWITIVLIKMFLKSQFRSVGAAPALDKLYRMLMAFSTTLRLWLFFLVLSTTLWLDQLDGGLLHTFLTKGQFEAYMITGSAALILVLPLVFIGDMAFRTERRKLTICYLVAQSFYVVYHVALLGSSAVYRWTLIVWPFFAVNVAAGLILCITTLVMAVICRVNFGRGLDHFLHVTSVLERDGFTQGFMAPERTQSKRHNPTGSWDHLIETGETVKVAAAYHNQPRVPPRLGVSINKKSKRQRQRDSTESFGHTTLDPDATYINEKFTPLDHTSTGDSVPVFDNRAAVRVPDGAGSQI